MPQPTQCWCSFFTFRICLSLVSHTPKEEPAWRHSMHQSHPLTCFPQVTLCVQGFCWLSQVWLSARWAGQRAVGTPAVSWYPAVGKGWRHHEQMEVNTLCTWISYLCVQVLAVMALSRDASCLLSSFSELYLLQRNCWGLARVCTVGSSHPTHSLS